MSFDVGAWETRYYDTILIGNTSGLVLYKPRVWEEGSTHGGLISDPPIEVDTLFDTILMAENKDGMTDYRKCHLMNTDASETGDKVIRAIAFLPMGLQGRLTVSIAAGQDWDYGPHKPADTAFSDKLSINLGAGTIQPIWIKRTINAGGDHPGNYLNIPIRIVVSGA